MKRLMGLILALILLTAAAHAEVNPQFEEACNLLAQAALQLQVAYEKFGETLDALEEADAGTLSRDNCLARLHALSDELWAMEPLTITPSDDLAAYMLSRGFMPEDFQAVADDAVYSARGSADDIDNYIAVMEAGPETSVPDTAYDRQIIAIQKQMDFVALNTVLLPADDEEAAEIQTVVVEPTGYLMEAGLPWERDLALCVAKYDALETELEEVLSQMSNQAADMEEALDQIEN